ncbi:MAG: DEAD/DEAH box helicase [Oscillospiraceae bacterium]
MTQVSFSDLSLTPKVERAVSMMGFDFATPIQSEAIPVIRTGVDVIARSQTGTGKTVAFGIPAIECIDTHEEKPSIQVLILCPTRELAVQGEEEIRKLARFKEGIHPVAIYGGAPIEKQCINLRRANIVVGTPGRVMDHMRRKTLKLSNLKMIVLDEADEMLNMGFKEDIETILLDAPAERQTVLFSATMPPAIMSITKQFQHNPTLIEIDKSQVTIDNIEQLYIDVPHDRKKDALSALLNFYQPGRALIFCGTKRMADELTVYLNDRSIGAVSIHSDIKQSQRTEALRDFKNGKTPILIATDIAARGIDVNDIEYVINYDIPSNTEYYVHRIGRTGRAGKSGRSITICSSKREVSDMRRISIAVKSEIKQLTLPTPADIQKAGADRAISEIETVLAGEIRPLFAEMLASLMEKGHSPEAIATAALQMSFKNLGHPISRVPVTQFKHDFREDDAPRSFREGRENRENREGREGRPDFAEKRAPRPKSRQMDFSILLLDIGASSRIKVNHIIGAITERTCLSGNEIGKVDITADQSLVEIPSSKVDQVLEELRGCKICGKPTNACMLAGSPRKTSRPGASRAPNNARPARPVSGGTAKAKHID